MFPRINPAQKRLIIDIFANAFITWSDNECYKLVSSSSDVQYLFLYSSHYFLTTYIFMNDFLPKSFQLLCCRGGYTYKDAVLLL